MPSVLVCSDELAVELQSGAEQRRQRHGLAQRLRDGYRHVVTRQDRRRRRAEAHEAPDDAGAHRAERQHDVVARALSGSGGAAEASVIYPAPRHQARMAFCACSRFSASSNTTDCGPSMTSSVDLVAAIGGQAVHEDGALAPPCPSAPRRRRRARASSCGARASVSPIDTQVSVTTQSTPRTAFADVAADR